MNEEERASHKPDPNPEDPVIDIVDFITSAVQKGICNCNLEPEVVYDSEGTTLVAL